MAVEQPANELEGPGLDEVMAHLLDSMSDYELEEADESEVGPAVFSW
ncbi:hypothetical protein [Microlunatus elymi]|nr:hypothetical protein [Microlunatus elymi]